MKMLVTGSSGLVGTALNKAASSDGHEVICLRRASSAKDSPDWNPETNFIDLADTENIAAVVHLAGENIAEGRWNDKKKSRILDSRVNGTKLLAEYFANAEHKPSIIVSASAIGIYGDRGDEPLDETSNSGTGYLADVCKQWEEATSAAVDAGIRVVNMRLGVVLSKSGGALKKMLLPFKLGLGGVIGTGKQYMSWVSIQDVTGMIQFVIANDSISSAVNLVSPNPISNHGFTKILGRALHRPTIFPMPSFIARLAFGEMANDLLLSSARVVPQKLIDGGYTFQHPELKDAFAHILSDD